MLYVSITFLVYTVIVHLVSLLVGSSYSVSLNIYAIKGEGKEVSLSEIYKIYSYALYFPYFIAIVLSWNTIQPVIHFLFMVMAFTRFILLTIESREISDNYSESNKIIQVEKLANIAAIIHTSYTLMMF